MLRNCLAQCTLTSPRSSGTSVAASTKVVPCFKHDMYMCSQIYSDVHALRLNFVFTSCNGKFQEIFSVQRLRQELSYFLLVRFSDLFLIVFGGQISWEKMAKRRSLFYSIWFRRFMFCQYGTALITIYLESRSNPDVRALFS